MDIFSTHLPHFGLFSGSCIDGRLTSAWNWCSKLQKPFFPIFKLSGFVRGFGGDLMVNFRTDLFSFVSYVTVTATFRFSCY